MEPMNLIEWLDAYKRGEFTLTFADKHTKNEVWLKACNAGWYDWFCSDEHCLTALKTLAPKVEALSKSEYINPEKTCLTFVNRCPMVGPTYDEICLYDMDTELLIARLAKMKRGCYGEDFSGWSFSAIIGDEWDGIKGTWKDVKKFFAIK